MNVKGKSFYVLAFALHRSYMYYFPSHAKWILRLKVEGHIRRVSTVAANKKSLTAEKRLSCNAGINRGINNLTLNEDCAN
jgi:hypothetical protein